MNAQILSVLVCLVAAPALVGQEIVAHYPFTNGSLATCDTAKDSVACPIEFGNDVKKTYNIICLGSSWRAAEQNDSEYAKNTVLVKLQTANRTQLCLDSMSFALKRDDTSVVRYIDVRADEDPGSGGDNFQTVLKTIRLPDTSSSLVWKTIKIQLDDIPLIQDVPTEVTLRLHLYGKAKTRTPCPTYLDEVVVVGKSKSGSPPCEELTLYSFTRATKHSEDVDKNSEAGPVSFANPTRVVAKDGRSYVAKLDRSSWLPAAQNSTEYANNAIDFEITPISGRGLRLSEISFYLWRDRNSSICEVDVRADEDPTAGGDNFQTVLKSHSLGNPSGWGSWVKHTIPLDDVALLQDVPSRLSLRLHLWGQCVTTNTSSTYIDFIIGCGGTKECLRAAVKILGPADCARKNELRFSGPPAFGTTTRIGIETDGPSEMYLLFVSVGAGDGSFRFPGSGCRVWLNMNRFYLWTKFQLDATGRGVVDLPILTAYKDLAGLEIGTQGALWTTAGDFLSPGWLLRIGCR